MAKAILRKLSHILAKAILRKLSHILAKVDVFNAISNFSGSSTIHLVTVEHQACSN
jgi:hypothetical protein